MLLPGGMRLAWVAGWLGAVTPATSQIAGKSQSSIAGSWVGGYQSPAAQVFFKVNLVSKGDLLTGTADLYENILAGRRGLVLSSLGTKAGKLAFTVPRGSDTLVFEGERSEGDVVTGEVRVGSHRGRFQLIRVAELPARILHRYIGTYRIGPERLVSIWPVGDDFGFDQLAYIDFESGRIGGLFPTSDTTFISGSGLLIPRPTELEVRFSVDGRRGEVASVEWHLVGQPPLQGGRANLRRENVRFHNGEVELAGVLVSPADSLRHPAVVLVHGSGAIGRDYYRYYADYFAINGLAVLSYDKRGVGESTGDWHKASYDDLAGDVLAGLRLLQGRPDIKPTQIGLWGSSQGGWIAPLAASRSKTIAFVISRVGPGVSPAEQGLQTVEYWLRADGVPESEIAEALALARARQQFARSGNNWAEYAEARERAKSKPWLAINGGPTTRDSPAWASMRLNADFDPVPVLSQVTCPFLGLFAEKDVLVPPISANTERMESALRKGGNADVTIKIIPNADHLFWISKTGSFREAPTQSHFALEAFTLMRDWLRARVDLPK